MVHLGFARLLNSASRTISLRLRLGAHNTGTSGHSNRDRCYSAQMEITTKQDADALLRLKKDQHRAELLLHIKGRGRWNRWKNVSSVFFLGSLILSMVWKSSQDSGSDWLFSSAMLFAFMLIQSVESDINSRLGMLIDLLDLEEPSKHS